MIKILFYSFKILFLALISTQFFYCSNNSETVLAKVGDVEIKSSAYMERFKVVRDKLSLPDNGQLFPLFHKRPSLSHVYTGSCGAGSRSPTGWRTATHLSDSSPRSTSIQPGLEHRTFHRLLENHQAWALGHRMGQRMLPLGRNPMERVV